MRRIRFGVGSAATLMWGAAICAGVTATPAWAQVRSVDPDQAIDGDLSNRGNASAPPPADAPSYPQQDAAPPPQDAPLTANGSVPPPPPAPAPPPGAAGDTTYHEDDLIGAAEGVFGKGAKGIAKVIESILRKQGEPNGYIVGREGGGAFVVGLRYGSGTLHHKIEGVQPVYWTGPSVGFDAGADAGSAFVLVYNLYDTQDLFHRFAAGEGQVYVIGGFNVSYLRAGDVVLVPVRLGVGLRLGVNAGYMKFSHKQNWVPF